MFRKGEQKEPVFSNASLTAHGLDVAPLLKVDKCQHGYDANIQLTFGLALAIAGKRMNELRVGLIGHIRRWIHIGPSLFRS